ncbi:MAG: maleylpyruvate isomerase N-terminal domain-containing protein [Nitriliruptoraceae bacterium]|nr:maleylpyruvate isomerase N-terminal domain-containing protein [Nitriliruptoraceae bacterium]
MMTLSDAERAACHREALDGFLAALAAAPDAAVAFYPAWRVRDLAAHLAAVHTMACVALETQATERPSFEPPVTGDADPGAIAAAIDAAADRLDGALDTAATEVWAVLPGRHPRAWRRRMLMEALLHRLDATQAIGEPTLPSPAEARDGIDEFLHLHARKGLAGAGLTGTVELRTDTGWWHLDLATTEVARTAGGRHLRAGTPSVVADGDPVALWAWLNRREVVGIGPVHLRDDDGTGARFVTLLDGLGRPA